MNCFTRAAGNSSGLSSFFSCTLMYIFPLVSITHLKCARPVTTWAQILITPLPQLCTFPFMSYSKWMMQLRADSAFCSPTLVQNSTNISNHTHSLSPSAHPKWSFAFSFTLPKADWREKQFPVWKFGLWVRKSLPGTAQREMGFIFSPEPFLPARASGRKEAPKFLVPRSMESPETQRALQELRTNTKHWQKHGNVLRDGSAGTTGACPWEQLSPALLGAGTEPTLM